VTATFAMIVGCSRSGTSILGEVVGAHHAVSYHFEPGRPWWRSGQGDGPDGGDRFTGDHATVSDKVAAGVWLSRYPDWATVLEKQPHLTMATRLVRVLFPGARLIHAVRDGRDVACSLRPGIGGDRWHHMRPPAWRGIARSMSGVERCAAAWSETVRIALDDLDGVDHHVVRYEDLVRDPVGTASGALAFLGLEVDPFVETACGSVDGSRSRVRHARHQDRWHRPTVALDSVGRHRHELNRAELAAVERWCLPVMERLGYTP